jgi:hypothetical protein
MACNTKMFQSEEVVLNILCKPYKDQLRTLMIIVQKEEDVRFERCLAVTMVPSELYSVVCAQATHNLQLCG